MTRVRAWLGWTLATLALAALLAGPAQAAEGDTALVGDGAVEVSVSRDGSVVGFVTSESLVSNDRNGSADVYVLVGGSLRTITVPGEGQSPDGPSRGVEVSGDGSTVAFFSEATNLVGDDTNGREDVFAADVATSEIRRVNLTQLGGQADIGQLPDPRPSLSADGLSVAWTDTARLTDGAPIGSDPLVYLRDLEAGATSFIAQGNSASLSGDGKTLAYQRDDQVYASSDRGEDPISVNGSGELGNGSSGQPDVNGDGSLIAFASNASDLGPGSENEGQDIFLRTRAGEPSTELVSLDDRSQPARGSFSFPALSDDGRFIAFLADTDPNACLDLMQIEIRDRDGESTFRAARGLDGSLPDDVAGFPTAGGPSVSGDGTFVGYPAFAANLVAGDDNGTSDGFVTELGKLEDPNVYTSEGPPRVDETAGEMEFAYSICQRAGRQEAVELGYRTADGTATRDEDYVAGAGVLELPGTASRAVVSVQVLDDDVEEPWETLYLEGTLGGAFEPARVRGTIEDDDLGAQNGSVYFERAGNIVALAPGEADPKQIAAGTDPAVSRDGRRLAFVQHTSGEPDQLMISGADGSNPDPVLVAAGAGEGFGLGRPAWSPDGTKLAVTDFSGTTADIAVLVDFETDEAETVLDDADPLGRTLSYSPDGAKLVFEQGREVTTLDLDSGATETPAVGAEPSYAPNGDLVYVRGDVMRIRPDGSTDESDFTPPADDGDPSEFGDERPAYSPDGKSIVFVRRGAGQSWIETAAVGGGATTVLTPQSSSDLNPVWGRGGGGGPPPTVSVSDATEEEGLPLIFGIDLSAPAASDVTVTAATSDGSATGGGVDFVTRSAQVTIAAGETHGFLDVATAEDTLDEDDETLAVTLSDPSGATIADGTATGTITDDDPPAGPPTVSVGAPTAVTEGAQLHFPVTLDHASATQVTVGLETQDGTATTPGDYTAKTQTLTIAPGQTQAFFDVQTNKDQVEESDETVRARIVSGSGATPGTTTATGTIKDDPPAKVSIVAPPPANEGSPLEFSAVLTKAVAGNVSVNLTTENGTATAPDDYTAKTQTVTIPAGRTSTAFAVATVDDPIDEPDETVKARILGGSGAVPGATTATGTIRDNDEPPPTVSIAAPAVADEGSALRFPVRLSRAANTVTVKLSTSDGTAMAPGDYTAQSLVTVTIPAGQTEAFFEVPTIDDALTETDETVKADIKSGSGASPGTTSATGTIRDAVGPIRIVRGGVLGGQVISGTIKVRLPGGGRFIDLGSSAGLPVGTQVDATHGVIELTSAVGATATFAGASARKVQRARFRDGIFTIRQGRKSPLVTLVLSGPELRKCARAAAAAAKQKVRRLWGDGKGRFRTKGKYAAGTVRGTRWLTEDRCGSTRVKVTRGRVAVQDLVRKRTRVVRAGRSLTVRARR